MQDHLLSVDDVAQVLRLHPVTVRKLYYSGELTGIKFGRAVRFRSSAIEQFIDCHEDNRGVKVMTDV